MSEEKHSLRDRLAPALPTVLLILLILQPLLDILSYWTDRLGMANTITLLLRFIVFAAVCLLGFLASSRKKVYGIAVIACGLLLIGHCIACFIVGYERIVYDLTNFIRVAGRGIYSTDQRYRTLHCKRLCAVLHLVSACEQKVLPRV